MTPTLTQESVSEFIAAVSNMRQLQRQYFRTRDQKLLKDAKAAEFHVDELLGFVICGKDIPQQLIQGELL